MINHIKIQLNLYSHREEDKMIIDKFSLENCENPNKSIRELLKNLSNGNPISNNFEIKKLTELEDKIKKLTEENLRLQEENSNLKNNSKSTDEKKANPKINSKLLASVNQLAL